MIVRRFTGPDGRRWIEAIDEAGRLHQRIPIAVARAGDAAGFGCVVCGDGPHRPRCEWKRALEEEARAGLRN